MELFFSRDIDGSVCRLDADESAHCVKVLRHREGDDIHVIDGEGTLYTCRILSASPKEVEAQVTGVESDWGAHPYRLRMAVCPTKNADRYEWFAEKATEFGLDVITPVIGDHSERKVFKTDRLKRILLSASKQSLKGAVPQVEEPLPLRDLIKSYDLSESALPLKTSCSAGPLPSDDGPLPVKDVSSFSSSQLGRENEFSLHSLASSVMLPRVAQFSGTEHSPVDAPSLTDAAGTPDVILSEAKNLSSPLPGPVLKLICCCYEGEEKRVSIGEALRKFDASGAVPSEPYQGWHYAEGKASQGESVPEIVILIGPEGDFSREEVALAIECGFKPVHLGPSRLRTETAALAAVAAVYFHYCGEKGM